MTNPTKKPYVGSDTPVPLERSGGYGRPIPDYYDEPIRRDDKPTDATSTGGLSRPDWDTPDRNPDDPIYGDDDNYGD